MSGAPPAVSVQSRAARARVVALGLLAAVAVLATPSVAGAPPAFADGTPPPAPVDLCTTSDPRLRELSGLVAGDGRYAIVDSGRRVQVHELGPDCAIVRTVTGQIDPNDAEDLARAPDGTFWAADIGDNDRSRDTVALITVAADGAARLRRLSYPDGPHDAEAVLLGSNGVPVIVTKDPSGPAGVYVPDGPVAEPGPTGLRRVGEVIVPSSKTEGGPAGPIGARTITGGAVSADGRVIALRTYTDAWLYPAPDGDPIAALTREPVQIPLPGEPQGEAIAFEPDGTLLSASETRHGEVGKLRAVPHAAGLVDLPPLDGQPASGAQRESKLEDWQAWLVALGVATLIVFGLGKVRRKG